MPASDGFRDHFSGVAGGYAAFRPRYPSSLFMEIVRHVPGRARAWDCATGSGQAAVGLASHFEKVVATDGSLAQLGAAGRHPAVEYVCAKAEASPLAAGSIDLVTVAQAIHWFDLAAFFAEARRVLRPRGVLAFWTYNLFSCDDAIDAIVRRFYAGPVGACWPPERRLVEDEYRSIAFPFDEVRLPPLRIEARMTLDEVAGFIRTWSAVSRYRAVHGTDPVTALEAELAPHWGPPGGARLVRWPIAIRLGIRQ